MASGVESLINILIKLLLAWLEYKHRAGIMVVNLINSCSIWEARVSISYILECSLKHQLV